MDKLKYIKLENDDGSYSDSIPLAVDSDHVDVNGNILTNVLNSKAKLSVVNDLISEVNSQKARIDSFVHLEDGSTTGDAELIDARIDCEGYTYLNLGSAVRSYESTVNNLMVTTRKAADLRWELGTFAPATGIISNSTTRLRTTGLINVSKGTKIWVDSGYKFGVSVYQVPIQVLQQSECKSLNANPFIATEDCAIKIVIGFSDDREVTLENQDLLLSNINIRLLINNRYISINDWEKIKNIVFSRTDNYFDKDSISIGGYFILDEQGRISNHTDSYYTGYLPIDKNTTYYYNRICEDGGSGNYCLYDSNKDYISGGALTRSGGSFIIDNNEDIVYIRFSVHKKAFRDNFMVMKHEIPTDFVSYYTYNEELMNNMLDNYVNFNDLETSLSSIVIKTNNLFNRDKLIQGYYYNSNTGKLSPHTTSYYNPEYIEVEAGSTYYYSHFTGSSYYVLYNANKSYISGGSLDKTDYEITIPENVKYIRLSIYRYNFPLDFMFMNRTLPEIYEPYYKLNDNLTYNIDNNISKLLLDNSRSLINQSNLIRNVYFKDIYIDHMFINMTGMGDYQTIPAESLFNIQIAKRLGFKVTEASVHKTADNKYIVLHGNNGAFGSQVGDLNGTYTYKDTKISSVTLDWIKENIRYKTKFPKMRVAPPSFEEWLQECKKLRMIPFFAGDNPETIAIANKIVGKGNYLTWRGDRNHVDGLIQLSIGSSVTVDDFVEQCDELGCPVGIGIGYANKTDEEAKELIDALHNKGYLCAWNSCYTSAANTQRALKLGLDISTSGWDIPDIDSGNICNLFGDIDYTDFIHTGIENEGVITLTDGQTITPNFELSNNPFLSGGSLHIQYTGTLHVKFGDFIDEDITSDGKESNWFSTYFIQKMPTFTLTSIGNTTINYITYKASKF